MLVALEEDDEDEEEEEVCGFGRTGGMFSSRYGLYEGAVVDCKVGARATKRRIAPAGRLVNGASAVDLGLRSLSKVGKVMPRK